MKAVRFARFGGPEVLRIEDVAEPFAGPDEAVVRVVSASINPSDVKNVRGLMEQTALPRTPGRDYAGVVESGPPDWVGAEVWGTGGDVGFIRDGTHAERVAVPAASLRRKPATLDFEQAASVGVNFIAAWRALVDAAELRRDETVLVIAASGGVGNAGVQIAHRLGARIIGVDRRAPRPGTAVLRIGTSLIVQADGMAAAVRTATGGRGADVVLDTVGGVMFRHALNCLAPGGRLVEMSVTGTREVTFDLADFYHNESRLYGVDTLKLDMASSAGVLDALTPGFESGDFHPAPAALRFPLEDAAAAYQATAEGKAGRVVLFPAA